MILGVLSDTHDRLPTLRAAMAMFVARNVAAVIHAGDVIAPFAAKALAEYPGTLHVIFGNNDGERPGLRQVLPRIQEGPLWLEYGGRIILVHHHFGWCTDADLAKADIVIAGHTHDVVNEMRDGKLFLNPGECCGWLTGRSTVALLDPEAMTAEIVEVKA